MEQTEATEYLQWPPDKWQPGRAYYNLFDAFRDQSDDVKETLIRQGLKEGIVHECGQRPAYRLDENFYCHYHEQGEFFSEWRRSNDGETRSWMYFQSEEAAAKYGFKFTPKPPVKWIR